MAYGSYGHGGEKGGSQATEDGEYEDEMVIAFDITSTDVTAEANSITSPQNDQKRDAAPTGTSLQQKHRQDQDHTPRNRQPSRPHGVKDRPRLHPTAICHEEVQPEYPSDIGFAVPRELMCAEVRLEGTNCIHEAVSGHPGAEASEERQIRRATTFGIGI